MTKRARTWAGALALPGFQSFLVGTFLTALALASVWRFLWLGEVPETPGNDLARHVAAIENFASAFADGQWVPRMQLLPREIPDIPLFQFYSFLLGLLGSPFLILGMKPILALTLAVFAIRWLAVVAIYRTGRLLGANVYTSLLASFSYLLTPYVIANLYARAAVPESIAHGVIAILLYGLVRLLVLRDSVAAAICIVAMIALSLAHPIFLLYGCVGFSLFVLLAYPSRSLLPAFLILAGGLLIAAFQWYPAFLAQQDIAGDYSETSPYLFAPFSSASGLYGLPKSWAEIGLIPPDRRLTTTPGILTVPVLLLMLLQLRAARVRAAFACCGLFLVLVFPPFDLWQLLPRSMWSLQFPYRMLAFVALFTSVGLCATWKQMKAWQFALLALLLTALSYRLLVQPPYSRALPVPQNEIAGRYTTGEYFISYGPLILTDANGELLPYSVPEADSGMRQIVDAGRLLRPDNVFPFILPRVHETYFRVTGAVEGQRAVSVWFSDLNAPDVPLTPPRTILPGQFAETFKRPSIWYPSLRFKSVAEGNETESGQTRILVREVALSSRNEILVPASGTIQYLHLAGTLDDSEHPAQLWIARAAAPDTPIGEKMSVDPGSFSLSMRMPQQSGPYILVSSFSKEPTPDHQDISGLPRSSIRLFNALLTNDARDIHAINSDQVDRISGHGYSRTFKIASSVADAAKENSADTIFQVELPMAYSRFLRFTQGNLVKPARPTERGLASVETSDLATPIAAQFCLPSLVWVLMAIGGALSTLGVLLQSRLQRMLELKPLPGAEPNHR